MRKGIPIERCMRSSHATSLSLVSSSTLEPVGFTSVSPVRLAQQAASIAACTCVVCNRFWLSDPLGAESRRRRVSTPLRRGRGRARGRSRFQDDELESDHPRAVAVQRVNARPAAALVCLCCAGRPLAVCSPRARPQGARGFRIVFGTETLSASATRKVWVQERFWLGEGARCVVGERATSYFETPRSPRLAKQFDILGTLGPKSAEIAEFGTRAKCFRNCANSGQSGPKSGPRASIWTNNGPSSTTIVRVCLAFANSGLGSTTGVEEGSTRSIPASAKFGPMPTERCSLMFV